MVVFGVQPGLLLDLVQGTVADTSLAADAAARRSRSPPSSSSCLLALLVVGVVARIGYRPARARRSSTTAAVPAEGGAAH